MNGKYKPRAKQTILLDRSWELVQSVPYGVTARWLFYRLLQEGHFGSKDDYNGRFLPLLAKARKSFFKKWTPGTLADDTRTATLRGEGYFSEMDFLKAVGRAECCLDKWVSQSHYLEIWFEAKAMRGQFEFYTKHTTLRPFGGDCSIPFKWQIARELSEAFEQYRKPIVILYFGDLDPKGLQIPLSAVKDIREWTDTPFEFIRCGLNPGDEKVFNIPENPEKPGTFQWEGLRDEGARELITRWTDKFVSQGVFSEIEVSEGKITDSFHKQWAGFLALHYEHS